MPERPDFDLRGAVSDPELADFVRTRLGDKEVFEIWVDATTQTLLIRPAIFFVEPLGALRRK